ncbi:MAG TPA: response regulator [Oculatellaceae cyanobacterium]
MRSSEIKKVLLVDDDQNIRFVAHLTLEGLTPWEIMEAQSGPDALKKVQEAPPDLVLLDMMMPGMDGPTTFSKLKEIPQMANVPVIFMTAKVQTHEVASYRELGATGVITKPFDPMTLATEIRQIVGNG